MKRFIGRLIQNKFVRNVAIVASGTAGAQAITLAFSPIITRLYGPEAFGLLGTFTAVLAIGSAIAGLTYPVAIVLPKNNHEAIGLMRLSIGLSVVMATLLTLLLLLSGKHLASAFGLQGMGSLILLIPIGMFFASLHQIFSQWLIRNKQFKVTAKAMAFQALIVNFSKTLAGLVLPLGSILIIIATIGHALHASLLWRGTRNSPAQKAIGERFEKDSNWRQLAVKYKDFPMFRAPQVALNAVSQGLPILMLAAFFGPVAAGFFALCKSALSAPATLIGKSIGDVFYPRVSEAYHKGENINHLLNKAVITLLLIAFVPFGSIVLFGPDIFELVFGQEWRASGEYARWVAVWMYFSLVSRPVVALIPVLSLQGAFLFYEVLLVLLNIIALYIGYVYGKSELSISLYSVVNSLFFIILYCFVSFKSKQAL